MADGGKNGAAMPAPQCGAVWEQRFMLEKRDVAFLIAGTTTGDARLRSVWDAEAVIVAPVSPLGAAAVQVAGTAAAAAGQ